MSEKYDLTVKRGFNVCHIFSKKSLLIVFLLLMTTIVSSSFIFIVNGVSYEIDVFVENEAELRNAIDNTDKTHCNIGIDDIVLVKSLVIPEGKNILLSGGVLTGGKGVDTIIVKSGGKLTLVGVNVTHVEGEKGRGVYVECGGEFSMWYSSIVGNTVDGNGGGVYNAGVFTMNEESRILDNSATNGGGVYNTGNFTLQSGSAMVVRNYSTKHGDGLYNVGAYYEYSGGIGVGDLYLDGGDWVYTDFGRYIESKGDGLFVGVEGHAYFLFIGVVVGVFCCSLFFYRLKKCGLRG